MCVSTKPLRLKSAEIDDLDLIKVALFKIMPVIGKMTHLFGLISLPVIYGKVRIPMKFYLNGSTISIIPENLFYQVEL